MITSVEEENSGSVQQLSDSRTFWVGVSVVFLAFPWWPQDDLRSPKHRFLLGKRQQVGNNDFPCFAHFSERKHFPEPHLCQETFPSTSLVTVVSHANP